MKKILFFSALGLLGCASTDTVRVEDHPPVYRQAYGRGCSSGYGSAESAGRMFSKEVLPRYRSIPLYSQGWIDGFDVCKARYENSIDESDEDYGYAWEYY